MVVAVPAKTSTFTTLLGCVSTDSLRALLMLGSGGLRLLLTHSDDNLCVGLGDASKKELMMAWSADFRNDFDQSPDSAGVDNLHEFLISWFAGRPQRDDHMLISAPAPGIVAKLPAHCRGGKRAQKTPNTTKSWGAKYLHLHKRRGIVKFIAKFIVSSAISEWIPTGPQSWSLL
jgi:hypothetical protein